MKHTPYTANQSVGDDSPHWQPRGLCRKVDPEIFFPPVGKPGTEAREVCARCPVKAECLAWALAHPRLTETGIYGGTSDHQRRYIRMGRPITPRRRRPAPQVRKARDLQPAAPLRAALVPLIGTRFTNRWQLCRYVAAHSALSARGVESFLAGNTKRVSMWWAVACCAALGRLDLPAQLWPTEAAA